MEKDYNWVFNKNSRTLNTKVSTDFITEKEAKNVRNFHKSFTGYQVTPLRDLSNLAGTLGIARLFVKDESFRFGLNAFKALGGSYAIGKYLASKLGLRIDETSFKMLNTPEVRKKLGDITFATATDGNHGRGVAWSACQFGHKSVVYMPKGSSPARLNNIKAAGAKAFITDFNYDDTVRLCAEDARKHGWVIIQDTSWPGYEEIPTWIMHGYSTMVLESLEQMKQSGSDKPTHILIQAGNGSLPGAIQGSFSTLFEETRPIITVVEPNNASCVLNSAKAEDGRPRKIEGNMNTIMAGLACGEPNPIAWNIMYDYTDMFISCPDFVAARGMRILGNPLGDDPKIVSGESGAVTTGILSLIMQKPELRKVRELLKLDDNSTVLLFSTEGDTDPEMYRKIVWDGAYPNI